MRQKPENIFSARLRETAKPKKKLPKTESLNKLINTKYLAC